MNIFKVVALLLFAVLCAFFIKQVISVINEPKPQPPINFAESFEQPLQKLQDKLIDFKTSVDEHVTAAKEGFTSTPVDITSLEHLGNFNGIEKFASGETETYVSKVIDEAMRRALNDESIESFDSKMKKRKKRKYKENYESDINIDVTKEQIKSETKYESIVSNVIAETLFAPTNIHVDDYYNAKINYASKINSCIIKAKTNNDFPYINTDVEFYKTYDVPTYRDYCEHILQISANYDDVEIRLKYNSDIADIDTAIRLSKAIEYRKEQEVKLVTEKFNDKPVEDPTIVDLVESNINNLNNVLNHYGNRITADLEQLQNLTT